MNTPSNAYFTKFSSGTILALLAFSGILVLVPLAAPVFAVQNASSPGFSPNPPLVFGGSPATMTVTVTNPSSNAYPVTSVTIISPGSTWVFGAPTPTCGGVGSPLPTLSASSAGAVTCTGSLLPGFGTTLNLGTINGPTPASASTPPITGTFTTTVVDGGSTPASYPTNSFNLQSAITTTIVYSPAVGATAFVAGSAASSLTVTLSSLEISVPVALTLTSTTPTTGYPGTLSSATVTTGTGGTATFTFTPSNHAPDVATVTATVGPAAPANAGPYTTGPAAPSSATFSYTSVASDGNDYSTASPATGQAPVIVAGTDAQFAKASILFALADTFGNPIALNTAGVTNYTITLTALSGGGFFDATAAAAHPAVISCSLTGGGFAGNWHSGASAVTPTT